MNTPPKNKLYHYCKLSTAIEYILPDKQLKLTPINQTNDPRENKSFIFGIKYSSKDDAKFRGYDSIAEWSNRASEKLRDDCKIICFSSNGKRLGYQLSQMWAQYGDMHKGICIQIEYDKFLEENKDRIETSLFNCVKYIHPDKYKHQHVNDRKEILDFTRLSEEIEFNSYIKKDFRFTHKEYLYFTKNIEWEHEQEFRLIYFSENRFDEFCSIKNSLSGIFLGVDFKRTYLASIKQFLEPGKVKILPLDFYAEDINWAGEILNE